MKPYQSPIFQSPELRCLTHTFMAYIVWSGNIMTTKQYFEKYLTEQKFLFLECLTIPLQIFVQPLYKWWVIEVVFKVWRSCECSRCKWAKLLLTMQVIVLNYAQKVHIRIYLNLSINYSPIHPAFKCTMCPLPHGAYTTLNPSNAEATFVQSTRMHEFFEIHLNHVMLIFIG